jgi:phosphoadenosine phosphosulfate reductase
MSAITPTHIPEIQKAIQELPFRESLRLLAERFPGAVSFSTSFSLEDQAVFFEIIASGADIRTFTLDTGRLFPETYSVWNITLEKYGKPIHAYYPDALALQAYVAENGPNAFYTSVDNRKTCCHIRKVEPLRRALAGQKIWITGLRAEHSAARQHLPELEWDEAHQLIKYHPILSWTTDELRTFIDANNIPYNPLHDRGFVSIGCAPCTRAIRPGEDFRAGRWWWEDNSRKECGLHEHTHSSTSTVSN